MSFAEECMMEIYDAMVEWKHKPSTKGVKQELEVLTKIKDICNKYTRHRNSSTQSKIEEKG